MKIFCIGLNKTGTISLHHAFERLGFRSLHWGGPETKQKISRAMREGRGLVDLLGPYDAYSDIWGIAQRFGMLDEQYPGARFVLNTRDLDAWLNSRRAHVERYETGEPVDVDGWRSMYLDHHERVRAHFAQRPDDLLEIDVTAGDGYEKLCPFLGVAVPDEPFPWKHKRPTATR